METMTADHSGCRGARARACRAEETARILRLTLPVTTDAARLAREGFKLSSDMGHPAAIGGLSVILSQSCLHIGLDQSGLAEMYDLIPAHLRPEAVDTTQGVATIFPALTLTLIRLFQGDRAGAGTAYALAGPIRSWTPSPAMRMAAWGHALPAAIGLGRTQDIEFLAERFEPFRGQHVANGAGSGTYMGPVEESASIVYLRPETAQGIYVNFLNVQGATRQKAFSIGLSLDSRA